MSDNGSGVFSINSSGQPVVGGTLITAAAFNALTADVAVGLTNRICRDGQTTITQNIPFNAHKITGLAAGTARTDGASLENIQDGTGVFVATVGGTADAITLTPSPAIAAYVAGQTFMFIASGANTTAVTVAISGLTSKAITKNGSTALTAFDIPPGMMGSITYDGTRFIMHAQGYAFYDGVFAITGSSDVAKKLVFEVDAIAAGTTRTITMPDMSMQLVPMLVLDKLSDESVTSGGTGTTLQNDNALTFPVGASQNWSAQVFMPVGDLLSTTGIKVAVTCPAAGDLRYIAQLVASAAGKTASISAATSGTSMDFTAASLAGCTTGLITLNIHIINGVNAGNVTVQWAQSTSSGTALTVKQGAVLNAHRTA